jgi:integrase
LAYVNPSDADASAQSLPDQEGIGSPLDEQHGRGVLQHVGMLQRLVKPRLPPTNPSTGLRLGEIRGLQWQDYDGESLSIRRSVWRTHVTTPKTEASGDKVPVIPSLRTILNEHRQGGPHFPGAFIFAGERKGAALNLANLARREMISVVEKGLWKGWHGFRRGLATRLHEAKVQTEVIQQILRHTDPKITQDSYIVVKSDKTTKAIQKVDAGALLKAWRKSSR